MISGKYNVNIDETVIYKDLLVRLPSNLRDVMSGLIWLIGLVEEHTGRMIIEIVENRKSQTLENFIRKYAFIVTFIITDGYPSYPTALKDAFCSHKLKIIVFVV